MSSAAIWLAAIFTAAIVAVGCGGDEEEPSVPTVEQGVAPSGPFPREAGESEPFRPCRSGPGGGGYRVRALNVSCDEVRHILPRMLSYSRLVARRGRRDEVRRNKEGWTCLVQPLPPRLEATQLLCVRGSQVILYRAG